MVVLFKQGLGRLQRPLPKMLLQKAILKTFYLTKTAFTEQYQSTLHRMLCLQQENIFRWLDIEFLKIISTQNFVDLQHNNKLTSEMSLLGFQRVWGLCASLLLSSIRLYFFMQRNHIDVLIFSINTDLEQCIQTPQQF